MKRNIFVISGLGVILAAILLVAGCAGNASAQSGTFAPTAVKATVNGDTVSIPADVLNSKHNVEFDVKFDQGTASYMAYVYNGTTYVRASICVPCRGRSFTLKGNNLICDTCGTVFSAQDGKGISGVSACQNYPKASVAFTTGADGNINMIKADLLTAFQNTLTPGLP